MGFAHGLCKSQTEASGRENALPAVRFSAFGACCRATPEPFNPAVLCPG